MKISKKIDRFNWKTLKYLFWLGPILIVMGLTAGVVSGSWGVVPIGLLIAGIVVIGLWLLFEGYTQPGFWGRRSTQVGTNALVATLAMLVILGLINFLAVRYSTRLDLTENQIFTLASQSQQVTQQLQQPVKVWIFAPNPNPVDQALLENYRRQNNLFSYEYVDPQAKPGIVRRFGVQAIGEVYLESGNTHKLVQTITNEERLSERKLTNALAQISNAAPQVVYFLQGHGERKLDTAGQGSFSQAMGRLNEVSYKPQPLNLATNPKVPDDTSVLIVAGPERPLLDAEITALKDYLKRKSGLLLLVDPETDPKLDGLLNEWGIQLSDRLIVDPAGQASGLGPAVTIVNQYGEHPITRGFGNGISFYPLARPVQSKPVTGTEATPLLITSDRTEAQHIDKATGNLKFDPATDAKGPFDLGVALRRVIESSSEATPSPSPSPSPQASASPSPQASPSPTKEEAANKPEARVVVIGNSSFATDGLFGQQLNGDVFLNSVSWLSQQDDQVLAIRPKEVSNRRIVMSPQQQLTVALVSLAFLPMIAFGAAAAVWWQRR
jgi:ABC-type uncharacterized transport system involved in gliding motility auxiliary subunit